MQVLSYVLGARPCPGHRGIFFPLLKYQHHQKQIFLPPVFTKKMKTQRTWNVQHAFTSEQRRRDLNPHSSGPVQYLLNPDAQTSSGGTQGCAAPTLPGLSWAQPSAVKGHGQRPILQQLPTQCCSYGLHLCYKTTTFLFSGLRKNSPWYFNLYNIQMWIFNITIYFS